MFIFKIMFLQTSVTFKIDQDIKEAEKSVVLFSAFVVCGFVGGLRQILPFGKELIDNGLL